MSDKKLIDRKARKEDLDNPEWTTGDFARARPASEIHGRSIASSLVRKRGRPPKPDDERKKQVTLRLSQDVLSAARETGSGWQARVDDVLRAAFTRNRTVSMADLGAAIVESTKGDSRRKTPRASPHEAVRTSSEPHRNNHKKRA